MVGRISPYMSGDKILQVEQDLLDSLLLDRSTRKHIIWGTDDYASLGDAYQKESGILPNLITGERFFLVRPRMEKTRENQQSRIRAKAEVFTPAWICNSQNNLVDGAWFGRENVFNREIGKSWRASRKPVEFPAKGRRSWKRYVDAKRLEITCGEAPYLVSRYDVTTGTPIPLHRRIGLLDRKLRVVNENTTNELDWLKWSIRAVQSVYGFEFQGDSLFLARENIFLSFLEYHKHRFHKIPDKKTLKLIARVISWNLWQMDGLKMVVPYSCHDVHSDQQNLFEETALMQPCPGCQSNDYTKHSGVYCKVMDWRDKQSFRFIDLMKGAVQYERV